MGKIYRTDYGYYGIGKRVKVLRVIADMTQKEMAKRLKVSNTIVGAFERNEKPFTEKWLKKFAKVFDMDDYRELLKEEIEVKI